MKNRSFENLECWKKSRILVKEIYSIVKSTNLKNDFVLRDQITRSAISIMSNIAEGSERSSDKEFAYFLNVAKASCGELRSQVYILKDVGYINETQFLELIKMSKDISKMIYGLSVYLRSNH